MAATEGGIIGKQNPSTASSASGMWKLNEVFLRNTVGGEWPNFNAPASISYSLLGGGGSGSSIATNDGNSGGAGSVPVQGTFAPAGGTAYTLTVGAGGSNSVGGSSSLVGIATAVGGGQGVGNSGSGGGVGGSNSAYSGGNEATYAGGGGAGAGGNGQNAPGFGAANGGTGVVMPLHPTGLRVGGGGGNSGYSDFSRISVDGGGAGRNFNNLAAVANRGGGGGANGGGAGFDGGSGRVILRYDSAFSPALSTTGSVTVTVSGGYRYYDFTSSGSITF